MSVRLLIHQIADEFRDFKIVSTLSTQLHWSCFVELLPLKDSLQREFYTELPAKEVIMKYISDQRAIAEGRLENAAVEDDE